MSRSTEDEDAAELVTDRLASGSPLELSETLVDAPGKLITIGCDVDPPPFPFEPPVPPLPLLPPLPLIPPFVLPGMVVVHEYGGVVVEPVSGGPPHGPPQLLLDVELLPVPLPLPEE